MGLSKLEEADGVVGWFDKEDNLITEYYVKDNTIYESIRGSIIPVGFVKEEIAYKFITGGRTILIGPVSYKDKKE